MPTAIMSEFVDCHTHLLPGVDDGAADLQESRRMLLLLKQQGVTRVWLTPHYYANDESMEAFLERRADVYGRLAPVLEELEFQAVLGAEVYLSSYLFNYRDLTQLCMTDQTGHSHLLLELPYCVPTPATEEKVRRLIEQFNATPILAHVERCDLHRKRDHLARLLDLGCLTQVNLCALNEPYFGKRALMALLRSGNCHFLGSDCHNTTSRPPEINRYLDELRRALPPSVLEDIAWRSASFFSLPSG